MYFFFYYPTGVAMDREGRPWVSWALMAFMVGVFAYFKLNPVAALLSWEWWVYFPGGAPKPGVLFSIFNHAGWVHLIGNLIYFWTFAPSLELALGRLRFLMVFLFIGLFANLCQGLTATYITPDQAGYGVVGASGAISAMMAMFAIRFPYARICTAWVIFAPLYGHVKTGIKNVPSVLAIGTWVAFQLISAMVYTLGGNSNTAFGTHFGGLLIGALVAVGLRLHLEGAQFLHRHRADTRFAKGNWLGAYEASLPLHDSLNPEDLALSARLARMAGQTRQARLLYLKATKSALVKGDDAGAAACYSEAQRFYPEMVLLEKDMVRLVLALDRLGADQAALRAFYTFRAIYKGNEQMPVLMLRAARIEEKYDRDGARQLYNDYLRLYPDSPFLQMVRSSLQGLGNVCA
ncbi:MAG: rhomboid family intramembrane serine protease [bacterium]|nr:rhomboid family intramembrane serine protease [bacterium]